MKTRLYILTILLLIFSAKELHADLPRALSFDESYKLALEQSENLKLSAAEIEAAEARYRQAVSAIYPKLSFSAVQTFRGSEDYGRFTSGSRQSSSVDDQAGGFRSGTLGKTQSEGFFSLQQPIFNGFRDFLLMQASELQTEAQRLELKRSEEMLYVDVAEVFYQVAQYQGDLYVYEKTRKVIANRIDELKEFSKLGKSRESEVLSALSELSELDVSRARIEGLRDASKELLAFLTGVGAEEFTVRTDVSTSGALTLAEYLEKAKKRYDIRAARLRTDSARQRVKAASRRRLPALNLEASTYPYEDPERNRDWQALVKMDVPVFDGGRISAEVAEEQAELSKSELVLQEKERSVERDIRAAYAGYQAGLTELKNLKKLWETLKRDYESQRRDYQLGVVSNLEVMRAIQQMQQAEQRYLATETALRFRKRELESLAGDIKVKP